MTRLPREPAAVDAAAPSMPPCASCRATKRAGDVRYLRLLPRRRRHRRRCRRDRATPATPPWSDGAATSRRSMRGRPPPTLAGLARAIGALSICSKRDFLAIIDGMEMDVAERYSRARLGDARLYCDRVACAVGRLSIARIRHGGRARRGARRSSRPRAAADQHPARPRRGLRATAASICRARRSSPPASTTRRSERPCSPRPRSTRPRGRSSARRAADFALAREVMDASPRAAVRAPRLMAAAYGAILDRLEKRGFSPPREACACRSRACCWRSSAIRSLLMRRPILHIVGAGLAGLSRGGRAQRRPVRDRHP